ncbi:3-hexulose-6-phosphate synthase [Tepidibacillus fermentans]|uniref:3-hexulose-6-phosphate synthase n=1 Tax=Tepidibacillus fermentans TaxID=1281767 RepID=A0A4R3K8Z4_9BACI|nr:3-hexulose-6-phosphate synthase [Tepidibacillus fermentans]TCS79397.1 3-hexulose-6-phosphate synthase [Tepidibacillus fermentans]
MKIQLALDRLTKEQCFDIVRRTSDYIDWIEVGTGVIKEYGMSIVRKMREAYPQKTIVADMKTCDAGKYEAMQAFEAGADITTIMAFSSDKTIQDALDIAKRFNKRIMIDLLGVKDKKRIQELKALGVDLVSLHIGKDMQETISFEKDRFQLVEGLSGIEIAVAGGLDLKNIPMIIKNNRPNILIVGSAITKAERPNEIASKIKELIQ